MEQKRYGKSPIKKKPIATSSTKTEEKKTTLVEQARGLLILHLDVDQGESTVLLHINDGVVDWCCVIDGGYSDKGRGAIARYLSAFGVTRVNALVCTHFDGDHTKGLTNLLEKHTNVAVDSLLVRNASQSEKKSNTKLQLLKAAQGRGVGVTALKRNDKLKMPNKVKVTATCVHADDAMLFDENDGSIALLVQYGKFKYYTAGDLPSERERGLLGAIGEVHAFKCGHHGSANSTPEELLVKAKPVLAFISCGFQSFGHPTYDVIERLGKCESLQGLYATNCIHNRKLLNPKYADQEIDVAYDLIQTLKDTGAEAPWDKIFKDAAYQKDKIKELSKPYENSKQDEARLIKRLLKAAERAAEHQTIALATSVKRAIVAGAANLLGTIALYVPFLDDDEPVLCVGFATQDKQQECVFKWHAFQRNSLNPEIKNFALESIGDVIAGAVFDVEPDERWDHAPTVVPDKIVRYAKRTRGRPKKTEKKIEETPTQSQFSTPIRRPLKQSQVRELLKSPMKYKAVCESRAKKYHRFDLPTVVGLRTREEKGDYVPFCGVCKRDEYEDEQKTILKPVFKLECGNQECVETEVFVHRECFEREYPDENMHAISDDVAEVEKCPFCLKAEEWIKVEDDQEDEDDSSYED